MSEKEIPVCECGVTPPYWRRYRRDIDYATLNNETGDWEQTHADNELEEFTCGECGDHASEDNEDKLQEIYL